MNTVTRHIIPDSVLDDIIRKHKDKPGVLLSTLEEAQQRNPLKFLPSETLVSIAEKLCVPYTQVYSVVTFYSFFNLNPQGKHLLTVCRGTACHTKGSKALLDEVGQALGFRYCEEDSVNSYTTPDNELTIRTVACFGQCAQSPVISVDGTIYSNVNSQKLLKILKGFKVGQRVSK